MFELSPEIIEALIFAMEDQEGEWIVDLATGETLPAQGIESREGDPSAELEAPPTWSSREGFGLMESFTASLRGPSARRDLQAALSRGRGVFRAFKEALAAHPEVERAFREYKQRAMTARIRDWYDQLREARGLEGLGPEPEDTSDLASSDLGIRSGEAAEARPLLLPLLDALEAEILDRLPLALAAWEVESLRAFFAAGDWRGAWIEDGEGGALAGAAGRLETGGGRGFGRLVFLYVREDFRRAGLGQALIDRLDRELSGDESSLLVMDAALLPREYGEGLAASGFESFGARGFRRG